MAQAQTGAGHKTQTAVTQTAVTQNANGSAWPRPKPERPERQNTGPPQKHKYDR